MSILNFAQFDGESAVVSVDTLNSVGIETSKLLVLPHLGVLAGRGRVDVFMSIAYRLAGIGSFDEAVQALERELILVHDALPAHDQATADAFGLSMADLHSRVFGPDQGAAHYFGQQVLLVGMSASEGGIDAISITRERPGGPTEVLRHAGLLVGPPDDKLNDAAPELLATDAGAYLLASLQLERCAEAKRPGYGGRLLVARMKRGEVTVRDVGRLERQAHDPQAQRAS